MDESDGWLCVGGRRGALRPVLALFAKGEGLPKEDSGAIIQIVAQLLRLGK